MTEELSEAADRAITWIRDKLGPVGDLPTEVIEVIWVTVFRSIEVAIEAEAGNGPHGLAKDLVGGGDLMWRFDSATRKLGFIRKMIPVIRSSSSKREIMNASQLLVDILKWDIIDAADMSWWQRVWARRSANADPMYREPVPAAIS